VLAIVAGADTTSTSITGVLFNLLKYPLVYQRLKQEVEVTFPGGEEPADAGRLSQMEWLNGCMYVGMCCDISIL